jgi:hypothetical protein
VKGAAGRRNVMGVANVAYLSPLTQDDALEIEAFLSSLTDRAFVTNPAFSLPTRFCGKARSG